MAGHGPAAQGGRGAVARDPAARANPLSANTADSPVEVGVRRARVGPVTQTSHPAYPVAGRRRHPGARRPHLPAPAARADRLPRLRGARPERQRDLRPAAAALGRGPRGRHLPAHQQPRWLGRRRHGDLRHDELHPQRRRDGRDGAGRLDGPVPALRGHQGQALRAAALADHDAPAVLRHGRLGLGHQDPGPAVAAHQEGAARADRPAHRPDGRADRDRRRPRPLVHRHQAKDYGLVDQVITSAREAADDGRPARQKN